jgi:hypothetical protein
VFTIENGLFVESDNYRNNVFIAADNPDGWQVDGKEENDMAIREANIEVCSAQTKNISSAMT